MTPVRFLYASAATLSLLSLAIPKFALFAVLLSVIALAALTRERSSSKPLLFRVLIATTAIAVLATGRFVMLEAMPGIIEARGRDLSAKSVSFLREILFAEDAMRRNAMIDPDHDGIGSAGLLGELAGTSPARGGAPLAVAPLLPRHAPKTPTRTGPALSSDGYLYLVCLPTGPATFSAESQERFDDEIAERRFLAYAWPESNSGIVRSVYMLDEHENILEDPNVDFRIFGPARSPRCDDALNPETSRGYRPWRGKKPRDSLSGDKK